MSFVFLFPSVFGRSFDSVSMFCDGAPPVWAKGPSVVSLRAVPAARRTSLAVMFDSSESQLGNSLLYESCLPVSVSVWEVIRLLCLAMAPFLCGLRANLLSRSSRFLRLKHSLLDEMNSSFIYQCLEGHSTKSPCFAMAPFLCGLRANLLSLCGPSQSLYAHHCL